MFPAVSGCGPCCPWHSDPSAFLFKIYVHLKEGGGPDGLDALKNKPQLHSMVARSLCRNAAGKNYIIFTGPSITSLNLFEEFEKQGLSSGRPGMAGSWGVGSGQRMRRVGTAASTDCSQRLSCPVCLGSGVFVVCESWARCQVTQSLSLFSD